MLFRSLVYKVAGACAESGASLEEVTRIAQKAVDNTASYGVAFSSCTLPGAERPIFESRHGIRHDAVIFR